MAFRKLTRYLAIGVRSILQFGRLSGVSAVLIIVAVVGILNLVHDEQAARVLSLASESPVRAAQLLSKKWAPLAQECARTGRPDEPEALLRAIIALERLRTPPLERHAETLIVYFYAWTGLIIRDVSVGPGQIKLSTFAKSRHQNPRSVADSDIRNLLTVCGTVEAGRAILAERMPERPTCRTLLDREDIVWAATKWNTSGTPLEGQGAFSHRVYQELVYHTFQELRFEMWRNSRC